MRSPLFFVIILVLCGCSKHEEQQAQNAPAFPPPSAPVADNRHVLVVFGDSLSAGFGLEAGLSFPDFLQKKLDAEKYPWRVVNQGLSGDTTEGGVSRIDSATAVKPEIVVLELGGNDGLRGLPLETTRDNLETMIVAFQKAGAKIVLAGMTLPPNYGPDYIRQFNQTYALLAAKYRVPMLPFLLENVYGVAGGMQADGIHATDQGNAQVAKNLLPLIKPLLKK